MVPELLEEENVEKTRKHNRCYRVSNGYFDRFTDVFTQTFKILPHADQIEHEALRQLPVTCTSITYHPIASLSDPSKQVSELYSDFSLP